MALLFGFDCGSGDTDATVRAAATLTFLRREMMETLPQPCKRQVLHQAAINKAAVDQINVLLEPTTKTLL
jgi:hypothetical protein